MEVRARGRLRPQRLVTVTLPFAKLELNHAVTVPPDIDDESNA